MTITEFLNARLDEDEAAAKAAGSAPWVADIPRSVHVDFKARAENKHAFRRQGYIAGVENAGVQAHIALHDPARALRDVAAKRAMVDDLDSGGAEMGDAQDHVLRRLASVYSDHPDFRQEWTP